MPVKLIGHIPLESIIAVVVVFSVPFIPFHFPVSFFFFFAFFFPESKAALCIIGEGKFRYNGLAAISLVRFINMANIINFVYNKRLGKNMIAISICFLANYVCSLS